MPITSWHLEADTETLEIIGALCFLPLGVPCSEMPGEAKAWRSPS